MGSEHRQFPRVQQPFEVQYRRAGELGQGWKNGFVINLSAGGVRFHGQELLEVGDKLELRLVLPNLREPLFLIGTVVWHRMKAAGITEYGIEFQDVSPDQRATIDELVRFLAISPKPTTPPP